MKRVLEIFLVFFFLSNRAISAEVNLLEGITWDSSLNTYTGYYDANKLSTSDDDSEMCWAFAASNQIAYWQDNLGEDYQAYMVENNIPTGEGETYEYAVTDAFVEAWGNTGGLMKYGLGWWMSNIDGEYYTSYTQTSYTSYKSYFDFSTRQTYYVFYYNDTELFSTKDASLVSMNTTDGTVIYSSDVYYPTELGGYWDDFVVDMDSVYETISLMYFDANLFISEMDAAIESNYTMTLSIYSDSGGSHAITLWGYSVDDDGNYSIFITDSDDGYFTLVEYGIVYNEDDQLWYFDDEYIDLFMEDCSEYYYYTTSNYYEGWYISSMTVFYGFDITAIPEPSNYATMLGLFALGFIYYRKSK